MNTDKAELFKIADLTRAAGELFIEQYNVDKDLLGRGQLMAAVRQIETTHDKTEAKKLLLLFANKL